jgi:hypothetical protein
MSNTCAICGCSVHRTTNIYARPTPEGRSHASEHHFIAKRFFSGKIFEKHHWAAEGRAEVLCYDCHEELLHNPILLPEDIEIFAELVKERNLSENKKTESREKLAGRIELLHEVIQQGLKELRKK